MEVYDAKVDGEEKMRFKCLWCAHEWVGDENLEQRCSNCGARRAVNKEDIERAVLYVRSKVELRQWPNLPDIARLPDTVLNALLSSKPNLPWESPPIPRIVPSVESWHRVMEVAKNPETKRRAWVLMLKSAGFGKGEVTKLAKEFESCLGRR